MIRVLRALLYYQLCYLAVQAAPSLSKMEGVITPDESVQSLTNNMANSLYTDISNASPSARSAPSDLISQNKGGQADLKPSEDFTVTNTITSSKSAAAKAFDQTSPAFNEVKPTAKGIKAKPKVGKNKKQKKDKSQNKTKKTNAVDSDNSLLGAFTTTTMPGFGESWGSLYDFTTTTDPFGAIGDSFTPDYSDSPDPFKTVEIKPPTTTFAPCSANIQVNPKNRNEYHYLVGAFSGYTFKCPVGLHFREDRCRCDWPVMEAVENCSCCKSGVMKHETHRNMFKRLINGVWVDDSCVSQSMVFDDTECKCVWDAKKPGKNIYPVEKPSKSFLRYNERCVTLLNMTLDKELKDEDGKHITARKIHSRRFKAVKGAVNKAMLFVYTPFELQSFKGNSLERNIYISFNFKPVIRNVKKVTLFSNGCETLSPTQQLHLPSIEINFFPHNETMQFIFRTESKSLDIYRKPLRDPYDWYKVQMYLQDKVLTIIVNNEVLYQSNGLNGKITTTNCNLMVGGSPFSNDQKYLGYMDEILIVKQCPYAKFNNLGPRTG